MADEKVVNTTRSVSPSEAHDILVELLKIKRPVFLSGQPGIGKSELLEQIAKELGRNFIDVRLLLMDPTDLRGIPYKNAEDKMVWAPACIFPTDPKDTSIILFDEITAAPPSVQAAALQLFLNRRVGEYVLPEGVALVAAGNRESDKTYANRMPSALANRFVHLEMSFNFDDYRDWALDHEIHPDVVGFLSAFRDKANTFNPKTNFKIFATPRTWTFVSQIENTSLPADLKYEAIAGTVGEGVMIEYRKHKKMANKLPRLEDILSGKVTSLAEDERDISLQHALMTSLIYKIKEFYGSFSGKDTENDKNKSLTAEEWGKIVGNFMRFITKDNNIDTEISIMALSILYQRYKIPLDSKLPEVRAFFNKHAKLFQHIIS